MKELASLSRLELSDPGLFADFLPRLPALAALVIHIPREDRDHSAALIVQFAQFDRLTRPSAAPLCITLVVPSVTGHFTSLAKKKGRTLFEALIGRLWVDEVAKLMEQKGLEVATTAPADGPGGTITVFR